jgi:hypothetical protein
VIEDERRHNQWHAKVVRHARLLIEDKTNRAIPARSRLTGARAIPRADEGVAKR